MVKIVGYLVALAGLALLYKDNLVIGLGVFIAGGFLAKGLFISLKSLGIVGTVGIFAFGYHHGFTPLLYFLLAVCVVMVLFNRRRASAGGELEWGWDLDWGDIFGGDGGSCDGGDGGGGGD